MTDEEQTANSYLARRAARQRRRRQGAGPGVDPPSPPESVYLWDHGAVRPFTSADEPPPSATG